MNRFLCVFPLKFLFIGRKYFINGAKNLHCKLREVCVEPSSGTAESLPQNPDPGGFGILLLCNAVSVWDCALLPSILVWDFVI